MGMYGEWLRVSPGELERAKNDLRWLRELASDVADAEGEFTSTTARRTGGTDKAWHALDFLLTRKQFPIRIIFGEESFVDDPEDPEADWGYGAPRYLTPEQVRQAAEALINLTEADLLDGVDQTELLKEQIYPSVWDRPDELPSIATHLPYVKTYFNAAATDDDAIICWIG